MPTVFLSLGSNIGDRLNAIKKAASLILAEERINPAGQGGYYETEPQGKKDQPWFLNTAMAIRTEMPPDVLLRFLKGVENELGRLKAEKDGPRVIDIDVIFYGGEKINAPGLIIPHARAAERRFVMAPLADIAPDFVHPSIGKTVKELLENIPEEGQTVRLFNP